MAIPLADLLFMQRRQALRLNQQIVDKELASVLRNAATDGREMARQLANMPGIGARTRAAQLQIIGDATRDISNNLWNNTENLTRDSIFKMADLAAWQSMDADKVIGMPISFVQGYSEGILASARISAESIIQRRHFGYTLSERVYRNTRLTAGRLNRVIESALVNNLSARELSKRVGQFIDPKTAGGASYAAMRLARTEINNAHHWVSADQYSQRPWISGVAWNLSGSHPEPDACDDLANSGPYERDSVPDKPHPQCLCYITPELPDQDEFLDSLFEGEYNDWLQENGRERIVCNSSCMVTGKDGQTFQRWDTIAEQEEYLEEFYDDVTGFLEEDELEFVENYVASSDLYNGPLRGNAPSGWTQEAIDQRLREADIMADAIHESPIMENIMAYRGVDDSVVELITRGKQFTDPGFTSVTLNQTVAQEFRTNRGGLGYLIEVEVPKGAKGFPIPGDSMGAPEQELILQKGSTFEIRQVDHIARKLLVRLVT